MMQLAEEIQVYLHREPVDFRKAINGLSVIVQESLQLDPFAQAVYVFTNRARNRVKLLYWQTNGFCLWQKRLEKDKFPWPRRLEGECISLTGQQLQWLLAGFDLWQHPPHQALTYRSVI